MINFKPLHDFVVVKPLEVTKIGNVLVPDAATKKNRGTITAVGPGRMNDSGQIIPMRVAVGMTILFNGAIRIDEGFLLVRESEVVCEIEGEL
jgi:chaperonin GroES